MLLNTVSSSGLWNSRDGMKEERNLTFLVLLMFNAYSANPNVVLAVTKHGGHLGFFEGITAHSIWYMKT
jgi:hypothetical protein